MSNLNIAGAPGSNQMNTKTFDTVALFDKNADLDMCIAFHSNVKEAIKGGFVKLSYMGKELQLKVVQLKGDTKVRKSSCVKIHQKAFSHLGLTMDGRACYANVQVTFLKDEPAQEQAPRQAAEQPVVIERKPFNSTQEKEIDGVKVVKRAVVKKPSSYSKVIHNVLSHAKGERGENHLVRVHNDVMQNFNRNQLIVVQNLSTGLKTYANVLGCGASEETHIKKPNAMRMSYDMSTRLDVKNNDVLRIRTLKPWEKVYAKFFAGTVEYKTLVITALAFASGILLSLAG